MSLDDAAVKSGNPRGPVDFNDRQLKLECLRLAVTTNPDNAQKMISRAAGIYNWVTKNETPDD